MPPQKRIQSARLRRRHCRTSIKVHKQKPTFTHDSMNLEETILRLLKPRDVVEMRRLDQIPQRVVTPAMIPTQEDRRRSALLLDDRVRSMATDIVERPRRPVFSSHQEDRKAGDLEGLVVAGFGESAAMREADPCL